MATFTMTLKELIELNGGTIGLNEYDGRFCGLDQYPIFDEAHRDVLNRKIIDHYWNREIGQENGSMFMLTLRRKMNEIMPAINQHYELSAVEVDPLSTVEVATDGSTTGTQTGTETNTNTTQSDASSRAVNSDHPQERLSGTGDYASSSTDSVSQTKGSGEATGTRNDSSSGTAAQTTKGRQGLGAMLVFQSRQAIVNVDMMVIDALESLFMLVWDNGDEYTDSNNYGGYFYNGIW